MGFFDNKDSEEFKAYETAAAEVDDVAFGTVLNHGIRKLMRGEKNSIILFKSFDEKRVEYSGDMKPKAIADFCRYNAMPHLVAFTEANAPKIFGHPTIKVHMLAFLDEKKEPAVKEALQIAATNRKQATKTENQDQQAMFITISP